RRRSRADVARGLGRFGLVRLARIAWAPVLRVGAPVLFLLAVTAVVPAVRSSLVGSQAAAVLVRVPPARHALARTHPAPALLGKYTIVRSGDTLGGIAVRFGTTVTKLLTLNPGVDPRAMHAGQQIHLP